MIQPQQLPPTNPFRQHTAEEEQLQQSSHSRVASAQSTNPFLRQASQDTQQVANLTPPTAPATHEDISSQLAGLDFGSSADPATTAHQSTPPSNTQSSSDGAVAQPVPQLFTSEPEELKESQSQAEVALPATAVDPFNPPSKSEVPSNNVAPAQTSAFDDEAYARRIADEQLAEASSSHRRGGPSRREQVAASSDALWTLKEVRFGNSMRKIVTQNVNGPCSLLALSNVLFLRGELQVSPEDRPAVSYEYLSALVADYLLLRATEAPADGAHNDEEDPPDVGAALEVLPRTQYGLDVNVCFGRCDAFASQQQPAGTSRQANGGVGASASASGSGSGSGSTSGSGSASNPASALMAAASGRGPRATRAPELDLFRLCSVPLVHGWLTDPSEEDTFDALTRASHANLSSGACNVPPGGDYDSAVLRVVEGDSLAKGMVVEGAGQVDGPPPQIGQVRYLETAAKTLKQQRQASLSERDISVIEDAILIHNFLTSTSTQLTYSGLFSLASTLAPGTLCTLFRNSHLSVLYRRRDDEVPPSDYELEEETPLLFTLVTDAGLLMEEEVVWQSLVDVDSSATAFYDSRFRKVQPSQDFAGTYSRRSGRSGTGSGVYGPPSEMADFAFASQLQHQEDARAIRAVNEGSSQRGRRNQQRSSSNSSPAGGASGNGGGGAGGGIKRLFGGKKSRRSAPSAAFLQSPGPQEGDARVLGDSEAHSVPAQGAYAPPSGPPPGHGQEVQQGSYAPPPGPPPSSSAENVGRNGTQEASQAQAPVGPGAGAVQNKGGKDDKCVVM